MKKKVVITGGTGFLGCHLARRFLKEKWQVTLFDLAPLTAKDLEGKVTYIKGDVRNTKAVSKALHNQDYVVHTAAALPIHRNKELIFSTNVEGTRNILDFARKEKTKKVVFISTTAVYGVPKHLPETETSPIDPIGNYGESKVQAENLCLTYAKKGLGVNIIRPKTFLGPERLGVFALWFEAIYRGKRVFILGTGYNHYQLLAVSDVVDAIYRALTTRASGEIFNIGAKEYGTWRSDLGAVIKFAKSNARVTSLPTLLSQFILYILDLLHLSPIAAWHYKTLPVNSYVSTKKAEKVLQWKAEKSNKQLLLENYKWYKEHRNEFIGRKGDTHRVGWSFGILNIVSKFI